jgi:hypothetical protein
LLQTKYSPGVPEAVKGKKGETVTVKEQIGFEKTERGWRGEDGTIY